MDPVNVSRKGRRRKGDVEGNAKAGERRAIRKNVIWKSLSISCGFPKNRKFREIMEIDRKFRVTTANPSEGLEMVQRFS